MEGGDEKGIVCVTGGAGYLASWLIMRLLQHGYSVRTTVRSDPKFKEDISHLKSLPGAPEKLQIFEADLDKPESFNDAIDGCVGVFHVAHPIEHEGKIPQETITKTSVEGTIGILKSCLKSKTVKRVVCTSSVVAAKEISNIRDVKEIDENMWTEVDILRELEVPGISYSVSKTLTERAALEFAQEHGLDLVTILPSMIVGPFIIPNLPSSISVALSLILGNEEHNKLTKVMKPTNAVHIDDVASAQIFLFESPKAKGRHICSAIDITIHDVAKFIAKKYPELQLSTKLLEEIEEEEPIHFSSQKLLSLGFKFKYGFEDMYDDAIQSCKEKGFL
ncbi:NAD-dependent epimerase/dehydratase [Macleaya cordata]|uniref:NAD-dependent epimerase/dehydratase n=1 Tax=Macleaya cordata TaxID=56857 RepID=A0A200QB32_MACCD|nr:NAD-dependent epimerase/dehydratase [Macleaya cordata]